MADVDRTKREIAAFLGVDADSFSRPGRQKLNPSFLPRYRRLYARATRLANWLRERDSYHIIHWGKRMGIKRWISQGTQEIAFAPMHDETKRRLVKCYEQDIAFLKRLLSIDLRCWR